MSNYGGDYPKQTTSESSSSEYTVAEMIIETAKQEKFVIAIFYIIMACGVLILMLLKFRQKKKVLTQMVFLVEVLLLAGVRIFYSFAPAFWWRHIERIGETKGDGLQLGIKGGSSAMVLVDLLPEVIFMSSYMLLITTWWVTKATALKVKRFSIPRFWCIYICIVLFLVALSLALALLTWVFKMSYRDAVMCESIVTGVSCFMMAGAAIMVGSQLLVIIRQAMVKTTYLRHVDRQVKALMSIAVVNFILKGILLLTIPTMQEQRVKEGKWQNISFPVFWEAYCIITEIVPLYAVLLVLNRKEPPPPTISNENELLQDNTSTTRSSTQFSVSVR